MDCPHLEREIKRPRFDPSTLGAVRIWSRCLNHRPLPYLLKHDAPPNFRVVAVQSIYLILSNISRQQIFFLSNYKNKRSLLGIWKVTNVVLSKMLRKYNAKHSNVFHFKIIFRLNVITHAIKTLNTNLDS